MLLLFGQTTIEFYINIENRMEAKASGQKYENPFDLGYRKNLERLLGSAPWYYNVLPTLNTPVSPLYPVRVMPGVLTDSSLTV